MSQYLVLLSSAVNEVLLCMLLLGASTPPVSKKEEEKKRVYINAMSGLITAIHSNSYRHQEAQANQKRQMHSLKTRQYIPMPSIWSTSMKWYIIVTGAQLIMSS